MPAGSQLARSFPVSSLSVRLVTQPVFGLNPADCPLLELGSTALGFMRLEHEGRLVLIIGDNAPLTLPYAFALDDAGRSLAPLDLSLDLEGDTVTVRHAGQALPFPAGPAATPSLEVVASAGGTEPWVFENFVVVVPVADGPPATSSHSNTRPDDATLGATREILRQDIAPGHSPADTLAAGTDAGFAATAIVTSAAPVASTLEVFTPPSVRHGRADTVRAAMAQTRKP